MNWWPQSRTKLFRTYTAFGRGAEWTKVRVDHSMYRCCVGVRPLPKKTVAARHPGIAGTRHGFDDKDEEELIDEDDDFEPDEELNIKAEADQPASGKAAGGSWPVAEAMDEEI